MDRDDGLMVEVALDDIALGHDADGLPKTVPAKREALVKKDDDRIRALERERDAKAAEADEARRAAEKAARLAEERGEEITKLGGGIVNARYHHLMAEIDGHKAKAEAAERDMARAMEAGDGNLLSKSQRLMSQAEAQIALLEREKIEVEGHLRRKAEPEQREQQPAREEPKPRELSTEEKIAQYPKASQDWLRDHMEYVTDRKLNAKLQAAAYEAEHAEGLKPHSAEFLEFLEQRLGLADGGDEVEEEDPPKEKARPKVVAAAPVSRNGSDAGGSSPNKMRIKLHPHLVKVAKEIGTDPAVYAQGVLRAIKEGKLPKNYLDADYPHGA